MDHAIPYALRRPVDRVPGSGCEMIRVPPELWPALESSLKDEGNFAAAWLQGVCKSFPGRCLLELQQSKPRLFPSLLHTFERTESIQGKLVLQSNGSITMRNSALQRDHLREGLRETELAAFRACRFQQGLASEGMLCNEPPIPLRVLDFLETQDLVSLSLASKSTHQAAHLLFKREESVADRVRSFSLPCSTARPHPHCCLQEAVADRVRSISLPCSTAHPHPQSLAQVLRGIRIGSLIHGIPESIPFQQGTPRLLSFNTAKDMCGETMSWSYRAWCRDARFWQWYVRHLSTRTFKIGERHCCGLGDHERWVCVLEARELQALQKQLSFWMMSQPEYPDYERRTFLEMQLLVRTAISEGETVLWWSWDELLLD